MKRSMTIKKKKTKSNKMAKWWRNLDSRFCNDIAKTQAITSFELSEEDNTELVILLLKSCRNSIMRTKDKNKPTYYGLPHYFSDYRKMATALIKRADFLECWVNCYKAYKDSDRRMNLRPTLGRINHNKGYNLANIEAQPYSQNTSDRAVERFSAPCIAVVATKADSTATVFESPSVVNAIFRIDEVMELGVTRNMMHGNLNNGIRRVTENYSMFIIGRERLMDAPIIVDMGIPVSVVTDDLRVRYVHMPDFQEETKSCLELNVDDFGVVYIKFVESIENMKEEVAV
ncbi:hypothetical protein [Paenibacillus odorifer]|nr:hypothetical protein [Paenibacillus odorifer]